MSRKKPGKANPRHRFSKTLIIGGVFLLFLVLTTVVFGSVQFENHDASCAVCHIEPESMYYQRTLEADTVDLASAHAVKSVHCINCHSGQGISGRAHAMMLGARDLWKFASGNYSQPAPQTHPVGDENCLKCHADYARQQVFNNHFHALLSKWQAVDPEAATCVSCHQSHTKNGDPNIGFLEEQNTVAVCQACHRIAGE